MCKQVFQRRREIKDDPEIREGTAEVTRSDKKPWGAPPYCQVGFVHITQGQSQYLQLKLPSGQYANV